MQNCRLTAPGLGIVRGGALCQRGGGVPIYYLAKFPKKTALKSRELSAGEGDVARPKFHYVDPLLVSASRKSWIGQWLDVGGSRLFM